MDNIKVLKLVTGEEIVASVTDEGSYWKLHNPVRFSVVPVDENRLGIQMQEFIMLSKDKVIDMSKEFVMAVCNPVDEIVNSYNNQFSTIALPPEKSLIT